MATAESDVFSVNDGRHIAKPFADFTEERLSLMFVNGKLAEPLRRNIEKALNVLITRIVEEVGRGTVAGMDVTSDYSVYTGTTGVALLLYHFAVKRSQDFRKCSHFKIADKLVKDSLTRLKGRRLTFLCGDAGPLALGALLSDSETERNKLVRKLVSLTDTVVGDTQLSNELLYGRVGYLYALLFVHRHITAIPKELIEKLVNTVVSSGRQLAKSTKVNKETPLLFEWHDKQYLGAAHGMAGILFMLIQALELFPSIGHATLRSEIETATVFVSKLRFRSGNYLSSIGSETDKLVHWCHGASGVVHLILAAHKMFPNVSSEFGALSVACGECVWHRGLLHKGNGLCHGVASSGYTHLHLYHATHNLKHLYRTLKLAEWISDFPLHGVDKADRPFSLFEGASGAAYFLIDVLDIENAAFPGFYV